MIEDSRSESYLFDPCAPPDAEIVALERVLGHVLDPAPIQPLQPSRVGVTLHRVAPVIALAVAALVVLWLTRRDVTPVSAVERFEEVPVAAPTRVPASIPPTARPRPLPSVKDTFAEPKAPAPRPARVKDPFKKRPTPTRAPGRVKNPFDGARQPEPEPGPPKNPFKSRENQAP